MKCCTAIFVYNTFTANHIILVEYIYILLLVGSNKSQGLDTYINYYRLDLEYLDFPDMKQIHFIQPLGNYR